jgi:hypothetical protein
MKGLCTLLTTAYHYAKNVPEAYRGNIIGKQSVQASRMKRIIMKMQYKFFY